MADRARTCLLASAPLSALATVTLALFFTVGQPWGSINDLCYAGQATAVLGALPGIRAAAAEGGSRVWRFATVAWSGMGVTSLLVAAEGITAMGGGSISPPGMPYAYLGIQSAFFLATLAWLPMAGRRLERGGVKGAWKWSLLTLTLIGYPVFAVWLSRRLPFAAGSPASARTA